MHVSDEARRLLGHKAWLRGSDYATVLFGAQIESEAVRDLAGRNQRSRDHSGGSGNPSGPDYEGE